MRGRERGPRPGGRGRWDSEAAGQAESSVAGVAVASEGSVGFREPPEEGLWWGEWVPLPRWGATRTAAQRARGHPFSQGAGWLDRASVAELPTVLGAFRT